MHSYGAAHLLVEFPMDVLSPRSLAWPPAVLTARVINLPMVKDQGDLPVCTAVVAVSLYEQLLLREEEFTTMLDVQDAWSSGLSRGIAHVAQELGWGWTFLMGEQLLRGGDDNSTPRAIRPQLLAGMPLPLALSALQKEGVLAAQKSRHVNDPVRLARKLESGSGTTVKGKLAVQLRQLTLVPTRQNIFEAIASQFAIGFAFGIDARIDRWMRSRDLQVESGFVCPSPMLGAPRLATHAAVIVGADLELQRVTVQNSFGLSFGLDGFFYIPFMLLMDDAFSGLRFYILLRAS